MLLYLGEDRYLQLLNSLLPVQFVSHSPGSFWSPSPALTVWKRVKEPIMMNLAYISGEIVTIQGLHASDVLSL